MIIESLLIFGYLLIIKQLTMNSYTFHKIVLIAITLIFSTTVNSKKLIQFVNPMIGTDAHGHTYPGSSLPFGMVQLSPDNGETDWDWCSGYHYSSDSIQGFSHTHISGSGLSDLGDISVLPIIDIDPTADRIRSDFSHDAEYASPGYYSVILKSFNIKAELTTSIRCGFHRYTFPKNDNAAIKLDLAYRNRGDAATEGYIKKIDPTTYVGYRFSKGRAGDDHRVYYAMKLSKPVDEIVILENKRKIKATESKAKDVKVFFRFKTTNKEQILLKVAISSASIDGALRGLNEIKGFDFDKAKANAEKVWENELKKIKIASNDTTFLETFYTALYHSLLAPTRYEDALGYYYGTDRLAYRTELTPDLLTKGADSRKVYKGKNIYTLHSLWDTFRALNPLFTIIKPYLVPHLINSYLLFYDQHGLLPAWDLQFYETNCMTGYHSVPVISDAILKGIKGFDYKRAYHAMKATSMQNIRGSNWFRNYGYVPQDKEIESVTKTLEYAYDDWCIAQVARKLGFSEDYNLYMKRSEYWRNVFDLEKGSVPPKFAKGHWAPDFDPYSPYVNGERAYAEGNSWQYTWFVPQNIYGLIDAIGSNEKFGLKLDSLFTVSSQTTGPKIDDMSGFIGQYVHGNEPSHHVAYLYNYIGQPWKTAERVNMICNTMYNNTPAGLSGNDDVGQMSAWYVFSTIGFYPVNPANGEYVIGTPKADKTKINTGSKKFIVTARNLSNKNIYIQNATLNGKQYTKSYILHKDIKKGGELILFMGSKPSKTWGVNKENLPDRN
jgi:predicted alpha-1,2-mannosidase